MDKFKIDNSDNRFPAFSSLDVNEISDIQKKLKRGLFNEKNIGDIDLLKVIHEKSKFIHNIDIDKNNFNLFELIQKCSLSVKKNIYINWYQFDEIDKMKLLDLSNNFFDIWYPSSDDIEIFDDSCKWVLSVSHHGKVYLLSNFSTTNV